jgi:hypothetical protein
MARTDIHRPSVINPEDYTFVAVKYDGTASADNSRVSLGAQKIIAEHLARTGGRYSTHEHGGSCHVCGAHALYLAVWHHRPTNTYICTGEECAEKFDLYGADFQAVRKQVARDKAFNTGKAKAERILTERNLSFAWDLYQTNVRDDFQFEERTIADLVSKLVQYGDLTEKQWNFLIKLITQIEERGQKQSKRDALHAQDAATSQHVGKIGDRITIEGTVFFRASFDGVYGTTYVTGIRDAAGNVYIQKGAPLKRIATYKNQWGDDVTEEFYCEKDDDVRIKATVKDHSVRDGVKQTIISRPKAI